MQDGIPMGKEDATNGVHSISTFIITTGMHVYTANKINECGMGRRHEQGKNTRTNYYLSFTSTCTVLLIDGATNSHSKETQEKTPLTDKGVRRDL